MYRAGTQPSEPDKHVNWFSEAHDGTESNKSTISRSIIGGRPLPVAYKYGVEGQMGKFPDRSKSGGAQNILNKCFMINEQVETLQQLMTFAISHNDDDQCFRTWELHRRCYWLSLFLWRLVEGHTLNWAWFSKYLQTDRQEWVVSVKQHIALLRIL